MVTFHLDDEGGTPPIPLEMLKAIHITKKEELKMGIQPEDTKEFRDNYGLLDTSPMRGLSPTTTTTYNDLFKSRKRAISNVSVSSIGSASRHPPLQKVARLVAE
jgi:hypothetical protein